MNKENCALKLVDEIILYYVYDARLKKHKKNIKLCNVFVLLPYFPNISPYRIFVVVVCLGRCQKFVIYSVIYRMSVE